MENKAGKVFRTVLSVLLAIIIFILGFAMEGILALRAGTTPEKVTEIANEIDWANVRVGFLKGNDNSLTWAQAMADGLPLGIGGSGFTDKAEDLMGRNFFKNFMAEKLALCVDDFYHNTGEGVIKSSELGRLLKDNADVCRTVFGVEMNDTVLNSLVDAMVGQQSEVIFSMNDLRDSNPKFFKSARFFCSYFFVVLLGILILINTIFIVLLQKHGHKTLKYVAWDLGLIGGAGVISYLMTGILVSAMNRTVGMGTDFYKTMLGPVKGNLLKYGLYTLIAMVIVAVIYKLCAVVVIKRSKGEINIKVNGDTGKKPPKGPKGPLGAGPAPEPASAPDQAVAADATSDAGKAEDSKDGKSGNSGKSEDGSADDPLSRIVRDDSDMLM